MKKTIGILTACLLLAGSVQAAGLTHAPGAITPDVLAEANAQLNSMEAETQKKETVPAERERAAEQAEKTKADNTGEATAKPAQQEKVKQQEAKQPRIIRKTVKVETPQENWYLTKPADFTYYVNQKSPDYSLAVPYAFGADLLEGLPAAGPMIARGASDTVAMTFNASLPNGKVAVFKAALAGKQQLPPPAPATRHVTLPADKAKGTPAEEVIEITEFDAAPQYTYQQVDVTPLQLPVQLDDVTLTEAGEYKTFQGLKSQYMQFKCVTSGTPCLLRLTLTEYSGYQYTGFYLFPEAQRLTFIPLANYSARSLQCGTKSFFDKF